MGVLINKTVLSLLRPLLPDCGSSQKMKLCHRKTMISNNTRVRRDKGTAGKVHYMDGWAYLQEVPVSSRFGQNQWACLVNVDDEVLSNCAKNVIIIIYLSDS